MRRALAALMITLPVGLVVILVGTVMDLRYRDQMQAEMRDYGRQRVLEIRALGRKVYQDFLDPQIGNGGTKQYQASAEAQEMRERFLKIREADPNIRAIAIYASTVPTASPCGVVFAMGGRIDERWANDVYMDGEVRGWKGPCCDQGVTATALFLRAPIAGREDQLMATAHLVVSVESFERDADSMRNWILVRGLIAVSVSFGLSFLLVSYIRRLRSNKNS
jgi:hypothetical protein